LLSRLQGESQAEKERKMQDYHAKVERLSQSLLKNKYERVEEWN
jgi:hypothetical protein